MSEKNQKICFVIPSFSFGGAERVVTVLASQLACKGYDISVIKYFDVPNEYPISSKVKVFCVASGPQAIYDQLSLVKKRRRIRGILREIRPDYVVPFLPHVALHTFLAGQFLGFRTIQTIRVAPGVAPASRWLRMLRDFLVAISYATFVQTKSQMAYFPTWLHKKIVVLPNPVSQSMLDTSPGYSSNIRKIVSIGRLTSQKNFEMLIRSVAELHNLGYNIQLEVYGDGELAQPLQDLICSLGCQNVCFLRGRTNDIPGILSESDLFVLASNFEGMPNALMEAMAIGLPCISTDCETGPKELLGPDRGILVPVNDQQAMNDAIISVIESPQSAAEMGRKAKEYMRKQYCPAIIADQFIHNVILRGNANGSSKKNL